ncbi:PREDICTED: deoxyribose-phosphate aldolase [Cyprinodon variegatus]|uniref:deoxyribose-phosphate aldolase n=1 Tax=Cyprinodon variegatus TaxID=28743 RepID=UPI000742A64C|nr:PREDICTED: deoxyribose-phosphate aldolase [Cyprinodon variegatus]
MSSMSGRNPGAVLDLESLSKVRVNTQAVLKRAQHIQGLKLPKKQWQAAWLLKAVSCIDLTTLAGDDTPSNVHRLCMKAIQPVRYDLLKKLDMHDKGLTTAAVCVYPSRVADASKSLKAANSGLPVASVATGFPAGQTPLETRLQEVRTAVRDGAAEIDIVINRTLALTGQWEGSDFIKTSTGKEAVNATYPVTIVMARAIRDYYLRTGHKVGFKPAGGIRTAQESLVWLNLIKEELGDDWLCPHLFRLGASSLLADIERQIYHYVTGQYAAYHELPMA